MKFKTLFKSQDGSMAIATIFGVSMASLSLMYVGKLTETSRTQVREAMIEGNLRDSQSTNITALSRYRAFLSERKNSDGQYIPALFPSNYYDGTWSLLQNNSITTQNSKVVSPDMVHMSSPNAPQSESETLAKVLGGQISSVTLSPSSSSIRLLRTGFADGGRLATHVDVKVDTISSSRGQDSKASVRSRVPLTPPQPFNPIVEVSAKGAENWTQDLSNLPAGDLEFRVLGSGIVFDADVLINGLPLSEPLGGWAENGKISHNAVNYLARNVEIGRFEVKAPAPVSNAYGTVDELTCQYTPGVASGSPSLDVKIEVTLNGPSRVTPSPQTTVLAKLYSVPETPNVLYSKYDVAHTYCNEECPFVGPDELTNDPLEKHRKMQEASLKRNFRDATDSVHFYIGWEKYKLPNTKVCANWEKAADFAKAKAGKKPKDFSELTRALGVSETWAMSEMYAVEVPSCKRTFLFERKACGCFADDTQITLGDGKTTKRISELTSDDTLWNPLIKKAMLIERITKGPEKLPLLKIKIGSKIVSVTGKHPFPTRSGTKPAFSLVAGEEVLIHDERWEKIESIESVLAGESAPIVWNVSLAAPADDLEAHYVLANGIVTGDLYIQSLLENGEPLPRLAAKEP